MKNKAKTSVKKPQSIKTTIKTKCLKDALIEAMQKSMGVISEACRVVGCDRKTFYRYYNKDQKFKEACDECNERALDFAESKLFELVDGVTMHKEDREGNDISYDRAPDVTAIIFYLKTRGKKRGYVEKVEQEVTHILDPITDILNAIDGRTKGIPGTPEQAR